MMDIVLINVESGAYDIEKAMTGNRVSVEGLVNAVGVDGFVEKAFKKAELYDNIEHILTDEQLEILEEME